MSGTKFWEPSEEMERMIEEAKGGVAYVSSVPRLSIRPLFPDAWEGVDEDLLPESGVYQASDLYERLDRAGVTLSKCHVGDRFNRLDWVGVNKTLPGSGRVCDTLWV